MVYFLGTILVDIVTKRTATVSSETIKSKHAVKTAMNRSAVTISA